MRLDPDRLLTLLEETDGLPPADRRARLARELGETAARRVSSPGALDRTALELLEEGQPPPDALVGAAIGGYRVRSWISSGGMGDVYLAEDGAGRRVALKALKRGLDTRALLARFRTERAALAALDHEHVVRLLDAGALEDGRPFLVMEHVEGAPITAHARERGLLPRARLALFLDVCEAVQSAHSALVLHRDLKPGNVLVTGDGRVKLLDFGLAKLLDAEDGTDVSRGALPLTPRYAPPELLRGERATVATDVYGLGLLLYELLAGHPALAAGAERRALRGDLEAITRKALEPEPRDRYRTAAELAEDVRAHLDGGAIRARALGPVERLARSARRHPLGAGALVALALALAAGFVGTWIGKREAERDASRGWGAHAEARLAASFLGELMAETQPIDVDARIARELAELPESEALVRLALGRRALALAEHEEAVRQLERALALGRDRRALNHRDRAWTLLLLGQALRALDDPAAGETLAQAVEAFRGLRFADSEGLAAAEAELAEMAR